MTDPALSLVTEQLRSIGREHERLWESIAEIRDGLIEQLPPVRAHGLDLS